VKYIVSLVAVLFLISTASAQQPVCTTSPCSIPCSATTTPNQILVGNNRRRVFTIQNKDLVNTLYVIFGATAATPDYTFGFSVGPGQIHDWEVMPVPNSNVHTVASTISVITQSGTAACTYMEVIE
jgi:hypothetical protein